MEIYRTYKRGYLEINKKPYRHQPTIIKKNYSISEIKRKSNQESFKLPLLVVIINKTITKQHTKILCYFNHIFVD